MVTDNHLLFFVKKKHSVLTKIVKIYYARIINLDIFEKKYNDAFQD